MSKNNISRGFTIVELLVSVAIIVLLTGIIVTNLVSSKAKARDSKRISDVAQIQLALERYFDRCGQYPLPTSAAADVTASNGCPTGVNLATFISVVPTSPSGTAYDYYVNAATPTDYVLHVKLENYNDALKDSLPQTYLTSISSWTSKPSNCYDSTISGSLDYCLGPR